MARFAAAVLLLPLLLLLSPPARAGDDAGAGLSSLRRALRAGDLERALAAADACLALGRDGFDEALYLKAVALHELGRDDDAAATARRLAERRPDSPWRLKARFLEARALARQGRFEPAEAIYEAEAHRLLSGDRKRQVAAVLVQFAEELSAEPDPSDPGALPPDDAKAYNLYLKTLELQIPRDLRDTVQYRLGLTAQRMGRSGLAIRHLRDYLAEFDPDWAGPVGSPQRLQGIRRENPPPAGAHVVEARYRLGKAQLDSGDRASARRNFLDLHALLRRMEAAGGPADGRQGRIADTAWQVVRTYALPEAPGELEAALRTAREFLAAHPDHRHAVEAAWLIARAYETHGRADAAIEAYEAFRDGQRYRLPEGDAARAPIDRLGMSPAELEARWRPEATFAIGRIRYDQRRFDDAIAWWQRYLNEFPSGPDWSDAQRRTVDARFRIAIDAVAEQAPDAARAKLEAFLRAHPLDARAPQVLFVLGQMHVAAADEADEAAARAAYRAAIAEWSRLVGKYPGTDPASVALYRTGRLHEERLGDLAAALDAYRRVTWGPAAAEARERVAMLTRKQLELRTPRTFRTGETASVEVDLRNVTSLTVRQYFLDPEAYFRKRHRAGGVEDLDIALIEPDATWSVDVAGYADYLPLVQTIDIPFPEGRPGVCLVNVADEDFEATTLVLRSDLDLLVKSSRREALVYVQEMTGGAPAAGVDLLLSDGARIFATGRTGDDGVFRGRFDDLASVDEVRVFAARDGHVASNGLVLSGLGRATGLAAKGYLYTDRPAYRPGQVVACRGVVRDVRDGQYALPAATAWVLSVRDPRGRLLAEETLALSAYGTFEFRVPLDPSAPVGDYRITARPDDEDATVVHTGGFVVQTYALPKMALALDFERTVVFPGETVRATATATWQWGEPVASAPLRCVLPDGRTVVHTTDAEGRVVLEFDTAGQAPGRVLAFRCSVEGEAVSAGGTVVLPVAGFGLDVTPARPLVLAGESLEVTIAATAADGAPAAEDVRVTVLRRADPPADPVLDAVPWIAPPARPASEVTVREQVTSTDPETGRATVRLVLDDGGRYIVRVAGTDRRGQVVTDQATVEVSGDEDATKLRILAERGTVQVGARAAVDLHCRLPGATALLTWEGETILEHRVVRLEPGHNPRELEIGHEHYPNFTLSAAVLDGRALRVASHPFTVERSLRVTVTPREAVVAPGGPGLVDLVVTDQLGAPVRAELSLALVDEALLAIHPDRTPDILPFFQADARRRAEFRLAASNGFSYTAQTREVVKAVLEEDERLARAAREEQERVDMIDRLGQLRDAAAPAPSSAFGGQAGRQAAAEPEMRFPWQQAGDDRAAKAGLVAADLDESGLGIEPRRELPGVGWWTPSIETDADGRAVVEIPMPETTTRWRLVARGVTPRTLVGQATAELITRKDVFVELKAPDAATEGDRIAALARVHNLTDDRGPAELTLTVTSGTLTLATLTRPVELEAHGVTDALFPPFEVPAVGEIDLQVRLAHPRHRDAVVRSVPVAPWGMEYADHGGGVATGSAAVALALPRDDAYTSRWLTVYLGPGLEGAVVDLALGGPRPIVFAEGDPRGPVFAPGPGPTSGSALLASASGLGYARRGDAAKVDLVRLERAARSHVASLVVTEHGRGGWGWVPGADPDWAITAEAFWALAEAGRRGLSVDAGMRERAEATLRTLFQQTATADLDRKAIILHALSEGGAAEFELANALYRERSRLGPLALACTALTLENLGRTPAASELVTILEAAARREGESCSWSGGVREHDGLDDDVPATAMALLAIARTKPASPLAEPAARHLLRRRGCLGFPGMHARGRAVAALAAWFGDGIAAETDATFTVVVNGEAIRTLRARGATGAVTLQVPQRLVDTGRNVVRIEMDGRGRYAYAATLRGFSRQLRDPQGFPYPYVQARRYLHAPLTYRDRPIAARSSSPVQNVEIGQRVRVEVDFKNRGTGRDLVIEEPIPAGLSLVPGSLAAHGAHWELRHDALRIFVPRGAYVHDLAYELVGTATGRYRALPTALRDAGDPSRMRTGAPAELTVLAPGAVSDDPYRMNDAERYALGGALFEDGRYVEALEHLWPLFDRPHKYEEREVARMLLWIHTRPELFDAARVVQAFELLSVRHPQLTIPFDRILVVGQAYRYIGELERAWLVFRATIDSSFLADSSLAAILQDEGQLLGSIDYQAALWWEYPDTPEVSASLLALSQMLYENAARAHELGDAGPRRVRRLADPLVETPTRVAMLGAAARLLDRFLTVYPGSPLRDDAAFSLTNAFLDLEDYDAVVALGAAFRGQFSESEYTSSFRYMEALGHFWQRDYEPALAAARIVAEGDSQDRNFARYILGQIHHARGEPEPAIEWYATVREQYPDAAEAIDYFRAKRIELDEVTIRRPGEPVTMPLRFRNVATAHLQVYKVDLMKLYLREKNLSRIAQINLAGIEPQLVETIELGDGRDYADRETTARLDLDEAGAYLVICRGDDLFASGLVLITPLEIEVQEDPGAGRVRVYLVDRATGTRPAGVHVKAIGSAEHTFHSGETDLRGLFIADGVRGTVTAIARDDEARYAFHRGATWLGPREAAPVLGTPVQRVPPAVDYQDNLRRQNEMMQQQYREGWDKLRRSGNKGVQVEQAR